MFAALISLALVSCAAIVLMTESGRDRRKIKAAVMYEEGRIAEIKRVWLGVFPRRNAPRIYRAVIELPNGGRLLRRFAVRDFGPAERLL